MLMSSSRAALVDPGALLEALRSNKIAGAALDAFDQEPLPPGDPLTTLPNVVMAPHHAGMMPEAIINGLIMAVENVEAFLAGKEINSAHLVIKGKR